MEASGGRGTRVGLGHVAVELVAGGPPEPFAWDLLADRALSGDALEEVAEIRGATLMPLSAEGDEAAALRDGQVWLHVTGQDGAPPRVLRAHVPTSLAPTRSAISSRLDRRWSHSPSR